MPTLQCASSSCLWIQLLRSILQGMVRCGLRRLEGGRLRRAGIIITFRYSSFFVHK